MLLPVCPLGLTVSNEPSYSERDSVMSTFVNFWRTIDDFIEYLRSRTSGLRGSMMNMLTPLSEIVPSNSSVGVVWLQPGWLNKTLSEAYDNLKVNPIPSATNTTSTNLTRPQ
uniref:Uncharacterized protein n=1 Tax=Tetranychus urticae TaxID=32264 RepID=T1K6A8_TETUR